MTKGGGNAKLTQEILQDTSPPQPASSDMSDAGNMDKIRDILFGNQIKDYENRFLRMEEQLLKKLSETQETTHRRMEAFETYFKKEITLLKERLKSEIDDRVDSEKKILRECSDSTSSLNKKISKVEESFTAHATELHDQLLTQSKNLSADMDHKFETSAKDTKLAIRELTDIKADRSALAELFMQFALQLSGEQSHEFAASPKK
jgi:hypothetical protein